MLFKHINIYFKMFKGATNPRHTYIPRLKGVGLRETSENPRIAREKQRFSV